MSQADSGRGRGGPAQLPPGHHNFINTYDLSEQGRQVTDKRHAKGFLPTLHPKPGSPHIHSCLGSVLDPRLPPPKPGTRDSTTAPAPSSLLP